MENLKYPIGRFSWPQEIMPEEIQNGVARISALPAKIIQAIEDLNDEQLDTPYRPEGWTIRQVIHHIADSHMNGYIRFKLALTEEAPTIKPYREDRWALLSDSKLHPGISIPIIEGVHQRWEDLMRNISESDWNKTYHHPEYNKTFTLKQAVRLYAWHSDHHLAHITSLIARMNW